MREIKREGNSLDFPSPVETNHPEVSLLTELHRSITTLRPCGLGKVRRLCGPTIEQDHIEMQAPGLPVGQPRPPGPVLSR